MSASASVRVVGGRAKSSARGTGACLLESGELLQLTAASGPGREDRREASGDNRSSQILRCWYTWRHDAPLEPLDEARYLELTRDAETGVIKVPVWAFDLTPVADDVWRLGYWFGAPLRMWIGAKAGDRVMGNGLAYLALHKDGVWKLEFEDILAG